MVPFTVNEMKAWCGKTSYQRGEKYVQERRVTALTHHGQGRFEAAVAGSKVYTVQASILQSGGVQAMCSCPAAASYYGYCKHVAAVLITIHKLYQGKATIRSNWNVQTSYQGDQIVASSLISLFQQTKAQPKEQQTADHPYPHANPVQARIPLQVMFICKVIQSFGHTSKLVLELKLGADRLYVVQNIGEFLTCLEAGQSYPFTKNFSYQPDLHLFQPEDLKLLTLCLRCYQSEVIYDEVQERGSGRSRPYAKKRNQRQLVISPLVWNELAQQLSEPNVQAVIETVEGNLLPFTMIEAQIPVSFVLSYKENENKYALCCQNLDRCQLLTLYNCIVSDEGISLLSTAQMKIVYELYQLLINKQNEELVIPNDQIEAFMSYVIPQLEQFCHCDIQSGVREQITSQKLIAKLFLDQDVNGLHGKLEFHYGDYCIDPWLSSEQRESNDGVIIIRDMEAETTIKDLFHASPFIAEAGEFIAIRDEHIYEILFLFVPQLRDSYDFVEVYTTPAVKRMYYKPIHPPKLKIDHSNHHDWLEVSFECEALTEEERHQIVLSMLEKKKYYRLPEGAFLSLESPEFQRFQETYNQLGVSKEAVKQAQGSSINVALSSIFQQEFNSDDDGNTFITYGDALQNMLHQLHNPDTSDLQPPASITYPLRDYQVRGFRFMSVLGKYGLGGILADDMGLGKTLQSIAFVVSRMEHSVGNMRDSKGSFDIDPNNTAQKTLIVAPASLIYNWAEEFGKFAPHIPVEVIAGDKKNREAIIKQDQTTSVWITTYHTLRLDIDLYHGIRLDTLILDEAQAIKNASSQTAQALRKLTANCAFALTGTPIENKLEDMWSIFHMVFPTLLGSRRRFMNLSPEKISKRVAPFVLRRLKRDVLQELPDRIDSTMHTELYSEQKRLYQLYLAKLQADTTSDLKQGGFQAHRIKILAGITRLRQICCHPSLFMDNYEGGSSKLEQLLELVEEACASGKRILIFSQFTSMLQIIANSLEQEGIEHFHLDGSTPSKERVSLCHRFNEGERQVFLISLKAGGTGLNLTGADTVILYDLWWNPAVEEQAAGRAHRMGQKQVVQVIRLVTKGTVEEKILALQERKRTLMNEVVSAESAESIDLMDSDSTDSLNSKDSMDSLTTMTTLTEEDVRSLLMI